MAGCVSRPLASGNSNINKTAGTAKQVKTSTVSISISTRIAQSIAALVCLPFSFVYLLVSPPVRKFRNVLPRAQGLL